MHWWAIFQPQGPQWFNEVQTKPVVDIIAYVAIRDFIDIITHVAFIAVVSFDAAIMIASIMYVTAVASCIHLFVTIVA